MIDVIDCVNLMNYLDCPTFERTVQCESARSFIKNLDQCGRNRNGVYLIDPQYWEFQLLDPQKFKRH